MNMKHKIKKGSFVRIEATWGDGHWCEVVNINKPVMSSELEPEQTYKVRTWIVPKWETANKCGEGFWDTYILAPDTAHQGMIKEVLNLDPAVADIFTMTTLKGK